MNRLISPKCDKCKKRYFIANDVTGMPKVLGFIKKNGVVNLCRGCIIELGSLDKQGQKEFFESIGVDHEKE